MMDGAPQIRSSDDAAEWYFNKKVAVPCRLALMSHHHHQVHHPYSPRGCPGGTTSSHLDALFTSAKLHNRHSAEVPDLTRYTCLNECLNCLTQKQQRRVRRGKITAPPGQQRSSNITADESFAKLHIAAGGRNTTHTAEAGGHAPYLPPLPVLVLPVMPRGRSRAGAAALPLRPLAVPVLFPFPLPFPVLVFVLG